MAELTIAELDKAIDMMNKMKTEAVARHEGIDCTVELNAVKSSLNTLFQKSGYLADGDVIDTVYVLNPPERGPLPMKLGFTIKRKAG